mgnify:CR=1 FL=1
MTEPVPDIDAVAALLAFATPAAAQTGTKTPVGVEELIVTAQKRPENVQDVPMSVSAFSGDQ